MRAGERGAHSPHLSIGVQPLTIVPLALALGTVMRSAEAAILPAANIGGDGENPLIHQSFPVGRVRTQQYEPNLSVPRDFCLERCFSCLRGSWLPFKSG
jgi:hypothetical protein